MFYKTAQVTWCRSCGSVVVWGFPCLYILLYMCSSKSCRVHKKRRTGCGLYSLVRHNGGRVFIFQVQCDAYTCTIKKMGSAAYIVNQQAKRLEIRDDGKRPRPSYFVFSLQSVLILYDYIYDIISDPRFFHF